MSGVSFTAVAKLRSYRVLLLFGGDRVEKLWNIIGVKAVGELCSRSSGLYNNFSMIPRWI